MNLLSIIIPAKNEAETIGETINNLVEQFNKSIEYEIIVVNDYSDDRTEVVLENLSVIYYNVSYVNNENIGGVGNAIKFGIVNSKGNVIAICMADGSDSPIDILSSYECIVKGEFDCVFGSRFIKGAHITNYPYFKKILNRAFNNLVKIISQYKYNDFTNIFKVYKRDVIESLTPIRAEGFSIGLEMSLKAFKNGYKIKIIPIGWRQRTAGESKLKLIKNIKVYFLTLIKTL